VASATDEAPTAATAAESSSGRGDSPVPTVPRQVRITQDDPADSPAAASERTPDIADPKPDPDAVAPAVVGAPTRTEDAPAKADAPPKDDDAATAGAAAEDDASAKSGTPAEDDTAAKADAPANDDAPARDAPSDRAAAAPAEAVAPVPADEDEDREASRSAAPTPAAGTMVPATVADSGVASFGRRVLEIPIVRQLGVPAVLLLAVLIAALIAAGAFAGKQEETVAPVTRPTIPTVPADPSQIPPLR
jgi:hypothetical protein